MCLNCSLSVKSMKLGMMIVFKALKNIGYGAIAKKSIKVSVNENFSTLLDFVFFGFLA